MSRHVKNGGDAVTTPRNNRRDNDVISYREFFVNSKNTLYYLICLRQKFTKNSYKITAKLMRKWNVSIGLKYNISIACSVRANNKCVDVILGIHLQCIPKNSHFVKTIFCTMTQNKEQSAAFIRILLRAGCQLYGPKFNLLQIREYYCPIKFITSNVRSVVTTYYYLMKIFYEYFIFTNTLNVFLV